MIYEQYGIESDTTKGPIDAEVQTEDEPPTKLANPTA